MTEAEWLGTKNPMLMLFALFRRQDLHRKLRLYACACCRHKAVVLDDPIWWEALAVVDAAADGLVGPEGVRTARENMKQWSRQEPRMLERLEIDPDAFSPDPGSAAYSATWLVARAPLSETERPEVRLLVQIIRDIFGNPFRPVTFPPEWRTSTAVALASRMYESRDFGAMPILADALQDAGCDNNDILAHSRDETKPHVRGCWVVDLVLGKE
jgi:hypothetical protein